MYFVLVALEMKPPAPSDSTLVPVVIFPAVRVRLEFTTMLALRVNPVLLFVRLLNVVAPLRVCAAEPLRITVPLRPRKVPLLVHRPLTVSAKLVVVTSRDVPGP